MQKRVAQGISFLVTRVGLPEALSQWQVVQGGVALAKRVAQSGVACAICAPCPPRLEWVKEGSGYAPVEDPYMAGAYERAIKKRPPAFEMQLKGNGELGPCCEF